jgi:hypothetical protein
MRKDVREFIRRLEAAGLTVESTPATTVFCATENRSARQTACAHAAVLSGHDPLAQSGNRRAAQTRNRPVAVSYTADGGNVTPSRPQQCASPA